jgi:hypothetical protein
MAYPIEFVRKLNFPEIPETLLPDPTKWEFFNYVKQNEKSVQSLLTDDQNEELNEWCQQNICDSLYYLYRITINEDPLHKDYGYNEGEKVSLTGRLYYPIVTGGNNVKTCFWANDKKTLLKEYVLQPKTWYLLAGSNYHSVPNIPLGNYRLAVSAQVLYELT